MNMNLKGSSVRWFAADFVLVIVSIFAAVFAANDFSGQKICAFLSQCRWYDCFVIAAMFSMFAVVTKIYRIIWRYASTIDFLKLVCVVLFDTVAAAAVVGMHRMEFSPSLYVMFFLILSVSTGGARVGARYLVRKKEVLEKININGSIGKEQRILVIGAGNAASILLDDMKKNDAFVNSSVVCAVDDDEKNIGKYIKGVRIMGTRHDIVSLSKKYDIDTIIFAIPSMNESDRTEILKICSETGCKLKSMPSVDDAIAFANNPLKLKNVEIEDLLDRMPIKINVNKLMNYVAGKTVLVTGGGGSIGSELCRQLAKHKPGKLIILDVYENNAYDIQNELKRDYPDLNLVTLIGSVRDSKRLEQIFALHKPNIVYHAAAHKHVPLMEDSPNEAIKNNVFGTYKTALCADKYGVERFVLISTDKAVNPTNVMGASKRICEMVVQSMSRRSKTEFVAVRFGNVLGSNGSVIPLFKKQIEKGGPVIVTHPDIIRYFMTIPEAVSLVLTAGAMAKGGEIFVLDMGKPVKILDLAKNMIKLMGYKVDRDIKIEFSGLRPGEKLFEEMLMDEEGLRETDNHLIHIGNPLVFDDDWFKSKLDELENVMYNDSADVRTIIHDIVPTYKLPQKKA